MIKPLLPAYVPIRINPFNMQLKSGLIKLSQLCIVKSQTRMICRTKQIITSQLSVWLPVVSTMTPSSHSSPSFTLRTTVTSPPTNTPHIALPLRGGRKEWEKLVALPAMVRAWFGRQQMWRQLTDWLSAWFRDALFPRLPSVSIQYYLIANLTVYLARYPYIKICISLSCVRLRLRVRVLALNEVGKRKLLFSDQWPWLLVVIVTWRHQRLIKCLR